MAMRPAPPAAALAALTDVDVAAGDGLAEAARLTFDVTTGLWRPTLLGPFDTGYGASLQDLWSAPIAGVDIYDTQGADCVLGDPSAWTTRVS